MDDNGIYTRWGIHVRIIGRSVDGYAVRIRYDDPEMGDDNGTERWIDLGGLRGQRLFECLDNAPIIPVIDGGSK